jgi:hypothetical protein
MVRALSGEGSASQYRQGPRPYHPGNAVILANSTLLAQNKALLARIAERQAWQAAEDAGQLFAAAVARSEGERQLQCRRDLCEERLAMRFDANDYDKWLKGIGIKIAAAWRCPFPAEGAKLVCYIACSHRGFPRRMDHA